MDILYSVLEFLSSNKAVIVGAAVTLSEVFVIFWNMRKKLKSKKQVVLIAREPVDKTTLKDFLWTANTINLFRNA